MAETGGHIERLFPSAGGGPVECHWGGSPGGVSLGDAWNLVRWVPLEGVSPVDGATEGVTPVGVATEGRPLQEP